MEAEHNESNPRMEEEEGEGEGEEDHHGEQGVSVSQELEAAIEDTAQRKNLSILNVKSILRVRH